MLCEMWSGGGKMRLDNLEQCFSVPAPLPLARSSSALLESVRGALCACSFCLCLWLAGWLAGCVGGCVA
eukprot:3815418-Rhodomonas_salina.1